MFPFDRIPGLPTPYVETFQPKGCLKSGKLWWFRSRTFTQLIFHYNSLIILPLYGLLGSKCPFQQIFISLT